MNTQPFEIRENIFNYFSSKDLCTIALVSKQWRLMAYQKLYRKPNINRNRQLQLFSQISSYAQSFVQELDLTLVYRYVTDKLFQESLCSLSCLEYIHLDQCTQLSPYIIHSLILNNMYSVQSISLEDCEITQDILALVEKACQHRLTRLNLCHTTILQPCTNFFQHLSSSYLICLDLSYCTWLSNATLKNISRGLPKLQHIELHWCSQITTETIMDMVQSLKYLVTIDIRNIEAMGTSEQVQDLLDNGSSIKKIMFTYKK